MSTVASTLHRRASFVRSPAGPCHQGDRRLVGRLLHEFALMVDFRRGSLVCGPGLRGWLVLLIGVWLATSPVELRACPFCPQSLAPSLGEQMATAQVVVIARWAELIPGDQTGDSDQPKHTRFEITRVLKKHAKGPDKGESVVVPLERPGPKGTLELWFGAVNNGMLQWTYRTTCSGSVIPYLEKAPAGDLPPAKRLPFYAGYLEHQDELLAEDAFREFASAEFSEVKGAASAFDPVRIREWLQQERIPGARKGLYGLMLGLCGGVDDEVFLRKLIEPNVDEVRLGLDGIMGGYLYLTAGQGLDFIQKTKIVDPEAPFPETYAAMQALRFLWSYGSDRVPREQVLKTVRTLVERPAVCDIVVNDLARWKDWSVQDRLMELYGTKEYNLPTIKRAIIRYQLASLRDVPEGIDPESLPHVVAGRKFVEALRMRDPKRVAEVERLFFPE